MAHILRFCYGWHSVEKVLAEQAIVHIGIDCEIAHAKRCEVLEEVSALTRIYTVVLQTSLNNDARSTDVRPFHWNAQPVVT